MFYATWRVVFWQRTLHDQQDKDKNNIIEVFVLAK